MGNRFVHSMPFDAYFYSNSELLYSIILFSNDIKKSHCYIIKNRNYLGKFIPASDPTMSLFTQISGMTCTYRPVQKLLLKDKNATAGEKRVSFLMTYVMNSMG